MLKHINCMKNMYMTHTQYLQNILKAQQVLGLLLRLF